MALPYPFAVQSVVTLALLGAPLSALGQSYAVWRLVALAGLCGALLIAVTFVPARRLPRWGQALFLLGQVALTALAQALAPAPLLDYVYLALVLQAIALFPPWLWIPFAVGVYAVWSGMLLVATANLIDWLQGNLMLAFPATCAIIAAIFYLRQQRRSEQVQHMLQQVQQRYDA
ncbi:MAG: two-component sensor histidine kinase, partial [Chloroflexaceae bacterium]